MADDPYAPGWRPEYTGDDSFGDVGSGGDFGVDLYHLYYAGRQRLPATAVLYADMATQVDQTQVYSRGEFTRPGGGFHPAHTLWIELRDELQEILGETAVNLWDTGKALVDTAAAYAGTDEQAAAAFRATLAEMEATGSFPITELPPEPAPPAPSEHVPLPPPPGEEDDDQSPLPPPPGEAPGDQDRSSRPLLPEE